jgi:hypothetical protein
VRSSDKAGKDVGEIIGVEPGIAINRVDEILALDADAVVYTPLLPNAALCATLSVTRDHALAASDIVAQRPALNTASRRASAAGCRRRA